MSDELAPIRKESPPPVTRRVPKRKSKYDSIVENLQKDPGEEYLVLEDVTTSTARVLGEKGCEVTTRTTGKHNRVNVWAKWPKGKPIPAQDDGEQAPAKKPARKPVKKTGARKRPSKKVGAKA